MKLLKEINAISTAEFEFIDEEAEEEWYETDAQSQQPDVKKQHIGTEYEGFVGLEFLGDVTSESGYRSGSVVAALYKDKNNNVYEVDTLSGDGNEHFARPTAHKVKDLGKYFL